jgi:AraC family transcriptional regulator of adaptative response / DNA-3-methyladenine glycosylase II
MTFDADAAYQVFKARDARFDGRLFVGVTSTGIYCRPVCRVRIPRRENCRFFDTPAQAEAEAFRPCMKCRPELAPGPGLAWSVMDASRTLARQAAQWLDDHAGEDETPTIAALAERLGVSDRHLRRIFAAEHGVTPLQYVQTRRLLLAKHLLTDTRLPVSQVAHAAGFRSLRRFNAAFAESYRMNPTRLRGQAEHSERNHGGAADEAVGVVLGYRPPYDTAAMLRFLSLRAIPGIEAVDGLRIRRSVRAGAVAEAPGWLELSFVPDVPTRSSRVALRFAPSLAPHSARVVAAVRRWLDLDASPESIDGALADLPGAPGLRLPGSVDAFEMVVRAVLGQQVTVAAARTIAGRLVDRFGEPMATPWPEVSRTFPAPEALATLPVERIAELGIIRSRAGAILALAQAWPALSAHLAETRRPEPLVEALCALPGIGPWTAHYIAMRALGWPDAFPPKDIAVLNAMKPLFGTLTPREAEVHAERWRPWRAYAVLRLWNTLT